MKSTVDHAPVGLLDGGPAGMRHWASRINAVLVPLVEIPAALLVVAEIVVLFAGILARYVFHKPIVWSDELAAILFLWLPMLGPVMVLSGLAPLALADGGLVGYRAASHGGVDADAVLGMRIRSCVGATRAYRPGLSPLPLSCMWQAVQRALRHSPEPDAVSVRCHRPRGALAPALQAEPARPARDVCRARHRVQL